MIHEALHAKFTKKYDNEDLEEDKIHKLMWRYYPTDMFISGSLLDGGFMRYTIGHIILFFLSLWEKIYS